MSKRLRLLILGIFIVLGLVSLYPTIRWYFFTTDEAKILASSNRQKIRQEAIAMAKKDTDTILAMLQETTEDTFMEKTATYPSFSELLDVSKQRHKDAKKDFSKNPTINEIFSIFDDENEVYQLLLTYYRTLY